MLRHVLRDIQIFKVKLRLMLLIGTASSKVVTIMFYRTWLLLRVGSCEHECVSATRRKYL